MSMRRSKRLVALVAGLALVAAACGGDDDDDTATTDAPSEETSGAETTTAETSGSETTTAETTADTEAGGGETTEGGGRAPAGGGAMTVALELNPDAVWDDGTPITIADLQCTLDAIMNTPASLDPGGLQQDHGADRRREREPGADGVLRAVRGVQEPLQLRHQGRLLRRLHGRVGRPRYRAAVLRSPVQAGVVEPRAGDPRPQRGVLER